MVGFGAKLYLFEDLQWTKIDLIIDSNVVDFFRLKEMYLEYFYDDYDYVDDDLLIQTMIIRAKASKANKMKL